MRPHREYHLVSRIGWLRAAVLGANDGIVSTASLILGVAASGADRSALIVAGAAGLVAGAMSMAAGEYVSVSSQSDTERSDLARETQELATAPEAELQELTDIYVARGVDPATARRAAEQMMAHDALGAHARDELHITETTAARPVVAAFTSAATFTAGAALPLVLAAVLPMDRMVVGEAAGSILFLGLLGAIGARAGGAKPWRPVARVVFWGALAMALTAGIGRLVGTSV
ncbi:VIT1/CCC1 family predicted Fe2+/Mn2+ transporter [Sphingobium sp. B1D7B]|uniref:VIT1/CCC1 transporter family protein n=1 Tax=Sphingobium TaxID=165695 RepID=UPI0015EC1889|nr:MULTISPECIES: VIT family protein [Sphingobium]MCW2351132.1 VIT1/CCC1 family predicted Fe2+/Mn2+ transporter [Sphingobium sp. B12D2B]MCW2362600.1 VIT1/CCC1 family predicted Fe2+/Mn2+ transporter [Sphingobium sp. B10D3B]MCW2393231.1 VIT1/CCC1 family predicted Fe2+/Mn2+ transporter [Sphingobium sp. B11D3A]MCW2400720.1 VIT1/CCC1 family predicted Fe2+/Mn2+ transporter [Sphingobium sp. B10D7B]MCW2405113.1 VIT1/CCC1 family predicted Fe2+/Mn2+ transporter [Sphingobium sp. B1D7B]